MYLTDDNKKNIAKAFSDYGSWAKEDTDANRPYSMKMKALAILALVENGIPHQLEGWAQMVMLDPLFADAEYIWPEG
jgi:hypothetical protein